MWETLRNVWRVPELRKKVLYTFFMLLIFRLVSVIPAPGVDVKAFPHPVSMWRPSRAPWASMICWAW